MSFQTQADLYNSFTPDTADVMALKSKSSHMSEQIRALIIRTDELQKQINVLENKVAELKERTNE